MPTNMAQLMLLPLIVSCSNTIQIGFTFLVPADPGSPEQSAVKRVCRGPTLRYGPFTLYWRVALRSIVAWPRSAGVV